MVRGRKNVSEAIPLLPPCKVCELPSTGLHYGVTTCTACKGFFRRSLFRKEPYICLENKLCHVSIANRRRDICTKCRFKKCLAVGMSLEGIVVGRYPIVNKSKYREEFLKQQQQQQHHQHQQKLQRHKQQRQQQQPSCSDSTGSSQISSSSQIIHVDDSSNDDDDDDDDDDGDDDNDDGDDEIKSDILTTKPFPTLQEFPTQSDAVSTSPVVTDISHDITKMTSLQNIPHHLSGLAPRGTRVHPLPRLPPTAIISPITHHHNPPANTSTHTISLTERSNTIDESGSQLINDHNHQQTNTTHTTLLPARRTSTTTIRHSSHPELYDLLHCQQPRQQQPRRQPQTILSQQQQQPPTRCMNGVVTGRHHDNLFHNRSASFSLNPKPPTSQTRPVSTISNLESSATHQDYTPSHSPTRSSLLKYEAANCSKPASESVNSGYKLSSSLHPQLSTIYHTQTPLVSTDSTFLNKESTETKHQAHQSSTTSSPHHHDATPITYSYNYPNRDTTIKSEFESFPFPPPTSQTRLVSNDSNGSKKDSTTTHHQSPIDYKLTVDLNVKTEVSDIPAPVASHTVYSDGKFDDCVEYCDSSSGKHRNHGNHDRIDSRFSSDNEMKDHHVLTSTCQSDRQGVVDVKDLGKSTRDEHCCDPSRRFKLEPGGDRYMTTATAIMSATDENDTDDKLMSSGLIVDDKSSIPAALVNYKEKINSETAMLANSDDIKTDTIVCTEQDTTIISCRSQNTKTKIAKRRNTTTEEEDNEDESKTVQKKSRPTQTCYDYKGHDMVINVCNAKLSPRPVFMLYKKPDVSRFALAVFYRFALECIEKPTLEPLLQDCYELDDSLRELLLCPYRSQQRHQTPPKQIQDGGTINGSIVSCVSKPAVLPDEISDDCQYKFPAASLVYEQNEMDQMCDELQLKHDRHFGHKSTYMTELDFKMAHEAYYGICQLRDKLYGEIKFIDDEKYFKMLKETGIDVDNRRKFVLLHAETTERHFIHDIRFFRSIPGFRDLTMGDRMMLLRSFSLLFDLVVCHKGSDLEKRMSINFEKRLAVRYDITVQLFPKLLTLFRPMFDIHAALLELDLSHEESVVFKALMITFPFPHDALDDPEHVLKCHENYHKCILNLIRKHYSPDEANRRYSKLMAVFQQINGLRGPAIDFQRQAASMYEKLLEGKDLPLYKMLFTKIED